MKKITFENATLVNEAKVTIDGVDHAITEAEYSGGTDLNAETFNQLQDNVEEAITGAIAEAETTAKEYTDDFQTYSTEEQIVGKWIDGKPIYRKVVSVSNTEISSSASIPTGIENLDDLVSIKGIYRNKDVGSIFAYPLTQNTGTVLNCVYDKGNIKFQGNETYSKATGRIHTFILEYTKTTD